MDLIVTLPSTPHQYINSHSSSLCMNHVWCISRQVIKLSHIFHHRTWSITIMRNWKPLRKSLKQLVLTAWKFIFSFPRLLGLFLHQLSLLLYGLPQLSNLSSYSWLRLILIPSLSCNNPRSTFRVHSTRRQISIRDSGVCLILYNKTHCVIHPLQ